MGTDSQTEIGDYYAWGETSPNKKYYLISTYKYYKTTISKILEILKYSEKDWKTVLDPEDDAARAILGVGYRIPTQEDWQELLDNCKWEAVTTTTINNKIIARWKVTGPNGKYIILPATVGSRADGVNVSPNYDTYYTTANLYPAEKLSDNKKYKRAVALTWPYSAEGSIKKPMFAPKARDHGVVIRPVFDRYSDK